MSAITTPGNVARNNEPKQRRWNYRQAEGIAGYGFITPAVLGITFFLLVPILMAVALVFMKYDILTAPIFVGFENIKAIFKDPRLGNSYLVTLKFVVLACFFNNLLGMLLGMAVNRSMPSIVKYLLRTALFFPVLTTSASLAVVWSYLMAADRGVLNYLLSVIDLKAVPWLTSSKFAINSVVIYDVWRACGYMMVLYLSGLQNIPRDYVEAP